MKLYRYRPANLNTLNEITQGKLWYSRYSELNDPFEGLFTNNTDKDIFKNLLDTFQICCFSKTNDSLLMWAHYADSHKGVCIEYEISDEEYKTSFLDVDYSSTRPILNEIRRYPEGHKCEGALQIDINEEGRIFRTKHCDWAYERETRAIEIRKNLTEKGHLSDTAKTITGVYFGLRCSQETVEIIKRIAQSADKIPLYQAAFGNNHYDIVFNKVDDWN